MGLRGQQQCSGQLPLCQQGCWGLQGLQVYRCADLRN